MNDTHGRDLWAEFRAIQASVRKKLLKKTNFHEVIVQYRTLADRMEEAEHFEQAALCHREIASIYAKHDNRLFERRHLLKSAKLFYNEQLRMQQMNSATSSEFGKLMEENYLEVIQGLLNQEPPFCIVGLTFIELAVNFQNLSEYYKSLIYLRKANKFVQGDIPIQIQILERICDLTNHIDKEHIDELMAELNSIWISIPKNIDGIIREQLLSLEAKILLLHLHFESLSKKQFLAIYAGSWKDSRRNSITTKQEFELFSQFIVMIQEQNYMKASEMFKIRLWKLMDSAGRDLCAKLVDSLNMTSMPNKELDDILSSTDLTELQKREKMFELLNGIPINQNAFNLENLLE